MARIKIQNIIERMDYDMRRALRDAVERTLPEMEYLDDRELFRNFVRAVGRKCSTWERVSDSYVEIEES